MSTKSSQVATKRVQPRRLVFTVNVTYRCQECGEFYPVMQSGNVNYCKKHVRLARATA